VDAHERRQAIRALAVNLGRTPTEAEYRGAHPSETFRNYALICRGAGLEPPKPARVVEKAPKILLFDIETAPLQVYVWRLGDQHVGIEQIVTDWHLMSFAAKWLGESRMQYADQRHEKNVANDKKTLLKLHDLLDQADIVVTQNGKQFDSKKVNARFIQNGIQPPSPYKHIDVLTIKRKVFGFTSNKLAYTSKILNETHTKSEHKEFHGLALWRECLKGNPRAWREMERYNKLDVLSLEEEYLKLRAWDSPVSISLDSGCRSCGGHDLEKRGYKHTDTGKYQQFQCRGCGAWNRSGENMLSLEAKIERKRRV
jgi:uncharacterized protein YprB with RNaseH-like and TPR domain